MKTNKIYQGDALEVLKQFPDNSIHTCVTSPPYWGLRSYGDDTETIWDGDKNCTHQWGEKIVTNERGQAGKGNTGNHSKEIPGQGKKQKHGNFCQKCGAWRGQLGLEPTPELYVKHIADILDEVKRVLRKDGTLWLNLGDSYSGSGRGPAGNLNKDYHHLENKTGGIVPKGLKPKDLVGIPWRVAFELQRRGYYLRSNIIWKKKNPMPESVKDRPTSSHEHIFLLARSKKYYYDQDAIREPYKTEGNGKRDKHGEDYQADFPDGDRFSKGARDYYNHDGKNKRDVWTVNTKPFPKAHFAVFCRELIRPCIKAGCPEKICSKCDTPYERKTTTIKNKNRSQEGRTKSTKKQRMGKNPVPEKGWQSTTIDKGFHPNCDCEADTKGGIVLDPFSGAGTTALEALSQNKRFIGIELNQEYIDMSYQRLVKHGYYEYNKYLPEDKKSKEKGLF